MPEDNESYATGYRDGVDSIRVIAGLWKDRAVQLSGKLEGRTSDLKKAKALLRKAKAELLFWVGHDNPSYKKNAVIVVAIREFLKKTKGLK